MKLLAFVARPESQARMAKIIAYGPTNRNAFKHIDAKVAANLPTNPEYRKNMFVKNDAWWVDESTPGKSNRQLVIEKWEEWKLKG
jgi:putative spermidine/putrescine transport system substrate-binding protein